MSTITRFKLPDVGEGLTEAELLTWVVAVGDTVEVNQPLCEIETAKSAVELPSPVAGVVETIHVGVGETVAVGTVLVTFRQGRVMVAVPTVVPDPAAEPEPEVKILVGTGPTAPATRLRHLRPRSEFVDVRGRLGVIDSVEAAQIPSRSETRVPIKGVRKAVATAMTTSAFTAPHVTVWLSADVTETVRLVSALKAHPRWAGVRVNPLLLVAKALLVAVTRHPEVNASWDEAHQEIVYHHRINLGIATASSRGLVVPNIKDAGALGLPELAGALGRLVETARAGKATPADLSRGTITLTNIGALGVDAGTPILNTGEAAILAFGAIRPTPWVVDGEITIRQVSQLALSFDHRLVDGELGSTVLTEIARVLTDPAPWLLAGTGPVAT